ncbi:MAG: MFS transporter [Oscillospiraceae bacterium]|jgi:OFA family oxalate/formate antiporter-like MFS transporter|nr:MFS transporter [Oscillospiraceae bacterium]
MSAQQTKKQSALPSIIGCLVIQLCVGIIYIWSILSSGIKNGATASGMFGITNAFPSLTSPKLVATIMVLAFVVGNFIGGFINDKKGPKITCIIGVVLFSLGIGSSGLLTDGTIFLLPLTYSAMGGIGSGIAYGACISCIQKWLPHKKGLASGLAAFAFGLSSLVFGPVSRWLMGVFATNNEVNYTPVFLTLAGVFFVLGIVSCIFVALPGGEYLASLPQASAKSKVVATRKNYTLKEAAKTVPFWVLFLYIVFINGTWNLAQPFLRQFGIERGLAEGIAVLVVSLAGIPNALGKLLMAAVSDRLGRIPTSLFLCGLTLVGALFLTFIGGYGFMLFVFVIAFGYGGPSSINAAISTDFFGPKNSGTNYGIIMLGLGISSVLFNFINDNLLKAYVDAKNYAPTFIMGAATAILAAACMLIINVYLKRMKKENAEAAE